MYREELSPAQQTEERIRAAACYAGSARAMGINLGVAGNDEKASLWLEEADAWTERQQELLGTLNTGYTRSLIATEAAQLITRTYLADIVMPPS